MPTFTASAIADPTPTIQFDPAAVDQSVRKNALLGLAGQSAQQDLSDRDQVRDLLSGAGGPQNAFASFGSGASVPQNTLMPYAMGPASPGQTVPVAAANDQDSAPVSGPVLNRQLAGLGTAGQSALTSLNAADTSQQTLAEHRHAMAAGLANAVLMQPAANRAALWRTMSDSLVQSGALPANTIFHDYPGDAAASVMGNMGLTAAERIQLLQNTYTPDGGPSPAANGAAPGTQAGATTGGAVGSLADAVHQNESGGSMAPGQSGDGGAAFGPMQVHAGALADVNKAWGTNYTPQQLAAQPQLGKAVGDAYLGMMRQQFGRDDYALGAYNAGPGAMRTAIDSGQGVAGLSASAQQYVATGLARLRPSQGGAPVQVASSGQTNGAPPVASDVSGTGPAQNPADAVLDRLRARAGQGGAPTPAVPAGSFADTLGQMRAQGLAQGATTPTAPAAIQAPPGSVAMAAPQAGSPTSAARVPGQNDLMPPATPLAGARTVPNPFGAGQAPAQAAAQPTPQQAAPAGLQAAAPASTQPGMPPSTPLPQGAAWMRNGLKQIDTRDVPKGYGVIQQADGQRVPWPLPNVAPEGRNITTGNVETGQTVANSRGQTLFSTPPNTLAVQDKMATEDRGTQQQQTDVAMASQQQQSRLLEARQVMQGLPTGANGESRAAWANWAETYMSPSFAAAFKAKLNLPDAAPAQEFAKLMTQNAGNQERAVAGSRGGIQMMQLFKSANPGLEMRPEANRDILNAQLVATQADQDYARGYVGWVNEHGNRLLNREQGYTYQPASRFDQQWIEQRNPQVYVAAANAMNGKPFADWSRGLNPQDATRAMGIIARIDPTVTVTGSNGHPLAVSGFLTQQQGAR